MDAQILRKKLEVIAKAKEETLKKAVAIESLHYEDPNEFFSNMKELGAWNLYVDYTEDSDMIYFYTANYEDIHNLMYEKDKNSTMPLTTEIEKIREVCKYAIEKTSFNIKQELEQ